MIRRERVVTTPTVVVFAEAVLDQIVRPHS